MHYLKRSFVTKSFISIGDRKYWVDSPGARTREGQVDDSEGTDEPESRLVGVNVRRTSHTRWSWREARAFIQVYRFMKAWTEWTPPPGLERETTEQMTSPGHNLPRSYERNKPKADAKTRKMGSVTQHETTLYCLNPVSV